VRRGVREQPPTGRSRTLSQRAASTGRSNSWTTSVASPRPSNLAHLTYSSATTRGFGKGLGRAIENIPPIDRLPRGLVSAEISTTPYVQHVDKSLQAHKLYWLSHAVATAGFTSHFEVTTMSERAVKHVRKFLGQRLRALRKQRLLSQERLGDRSRLSGKFIGEVERGEKSISVDSLYRVSVALGVPLRDLADVRAGKDKTVPSEEAEKLFALVSGHRRTEEIRKAYDVLRAMFGKAS
jgi:transcriptional regulator with XRE-family HTH domain